MASVPQSTLNWLYDVLTQLNYRDPNRAYSDLAQTIGQYPGLPPRSSVYTSENGSSTLLVNLKGTLPVNFRGTVYRFPLTIWIPQAYPLESPLVYVTPTEDMVVRQGQHVSGADGKVYHHYLAGWRQNMDRCNVIELLLILSDIFSREPPVMAKPQNTAAQRPPRQASLGSSPGPPPAPANPQVQSRSQGNRPTSQYGGAPPPPPKPFAGQPPPRTDSMASTPPPPAPKPGRYDVPPPLPSQSSSSSPQPQGMYVNGHVQPPGGMNYLPQRQNYMPPSGQPLSGQQVQAQPMPYPTSSPGPPQAARQQQSPPPHPQSYQVGAPSSYQGQTYQGQGQGPPQQHYLQQGNQPVGQSSINQQSVSQQRPLSIIQQQVKQPQRDLLSEEDPFQLSLPTTQSNIPAPSIPPNPEKTALLSHLSHQILQHLHQSIDQTNKAAIPSLQAQHHALQTAQATLSSEINQLQTLSSHLTSNISALTQTLNQANTTIASTRDESHPSNPKNIPSIDEIIIPPSVIARQLYDNVSEQRGYESAIYALNEAFARGRVGSEIWSRKVRECAREEFRRKWMVRRIGEGLGLEGTY